MGEPIKLSQLKGNAAMRAKSLSHSKGLDCSGLGYLCLITLPMGWASATGVMQAVHRAILVHHPHPRRALPTASEIRKSSVLPTGPDQRFHSGWQVYLDNFASLNVVKEASLRKAAV